MKTIQPSDEALAVFAHELRQPLASILFAVRSIYESAGDEYANRAMCEIVERQARFLAQMIEEVLDVSRCNRGSLVLEKRRCDLGVVIAGAIDTTASLFAASKHRLTISLPDPPVSVMGDPFRLQQVIINLLANAAKYTEPGGWTRLGVDVTEDWVVIEVHDNGIGIPSDLLPRIFDLFEQGRVAQRHRRCGLGIGLALVKSVVELHGGCVSAYSDGLGLGSAFIVRLPRSAADGGSATSTPLEGTRRSADSREILCKSAMPID